MTEQSTAAKPKTSHLSHKPSPVWFSLWGNHILWAIWRKQSDFCFAKTDKSAKNKLAGFAEFAQICGTTQTRNRDAFGTPYLSNIDSGMSFGYTGKIFDSATGLYDYGFRDYSPNSARFTTVDPVRDGANWFSYVVNDPVNYIDQFGLETKGLVDSVKSWIEDNFTSEVINDTDYYLYVRTENDKNPDIQESLDNFVTTNAKSTLTESLGGVKIPTDGIVFPDGSVYKGWSGSKVTVTEKNGNIEVKQSVGTAIANGIANLGKAIQNIFLPADQKKEYYGYYTKEEVAKMEGKQDSIAGWKNEIVDSNKSDYFKQKSNTETKATQGCTK